MAMPYPEDHGVTYGQPSLNMYGACSNPAPYASMFDDRKEGLEQKGSFVRGQRRRMNMYSIFLAVVVPWALFTIVGATLSFAMDYKEPGLSWAIVFAAFAVVVIVGMLALSVTGRWFANAERQPTWLVFLFLSMCVAFFAALAMGAINYYSHMKPYYVMRNLGNYSNISPAKMRGQQLMDAGMIEFVPGAHIDLTKSMGFKNRAIYCVAPITLNNETLGTYDFWAVGKDCCSGNQANFHCPNFNNPHANGGFRVMSDDDRAYYRLAVQQAEATYNIRAIHPLFFEWAVEPVATVDGWKHGARKDFLIWVLSFLVFQIVVVAITALAFSKMGFS